MPADRLVGRGQARACLAVRFGRGYRGAADGRRYGGEEFLLLLPDTGRDQAVVVDAGDADTLIRAADRALHAAKANGRNRVELFSSPPRSARTPV